MSAQKPCSRCGVLKDLGEFHRQGPGRRGDGRASHCAACQSLLNREYRYVNRDHIAKQQAQYRADRREERATVERDRYRAAPHVFRARARWRRHQINPRSWLTLIDFQHGRCGTCGTTQPGTRGWNVDHDHKCCDSRPSCGRCIRGALCVACNIRLGHVERSVAEGNASLTGQFANYVADPPMRQLCRAVTIGSSLLGSPSE